MADMVLEEQRKKAKESAGKVEWEQDAEVERV